MAYDEGLAERVEAYVSDMPGMSQTKMFGGMGYLLNGNMCVGIWKDSLVIRVGVDSASDIADQPGVGPFDITGRAMKGWALVSPEGLGEDEELHHYIDLSVAFVQTLPAK